MSDFEFPEFYSFPPFFTIQPVEETREKQLALWRQLIVNYHQHHKQPTLIVHECPLFSNNKIGRSLSKEAIQTIMNDLQSRGNAEAIHDDDEEEEQGGGKNREGFTRSYYRILWRTTDELATDIYEWAVQNGNIGSVCTVYELHSGEDVQDASFYHMDESLIRRALTLLENQGKCAIFQGETSSEDGIKFF